MRSTRPPPYSNRIISRQIPAVSPEFSNPFNSIKNPLTIGTWNVLSLTSISAKHDELASVISQYKVDILLLTETHWPGTEVEILSNGAMIINCGRSDGIRRQGVGLILSKAVKNSLISYNPMSERVMSARIHTRHVNISVVVGYAPTEDSSISDKDQFYNQLTGVLDKVPRQDILLLGGDFNARICGGQSMHSSTNYNGQRLSDMCSLYGLAIGGTIFEHKNIHKGTWRSPDKKTITQIDHLCIGKKWRSSLLDVRAYRGADIGSNHYLVLGRLKVRLSAYRNHNTTKKILPALENLRNQTKVPAFYIALTNRFLALTPEENFDDKWENFKEVVETVSLEVLGTRPKRIKEQHLSQNTRDLTTQRSLVKRKSPEGGLEYSRLNKLVKKSAKTDDQRWADNLAKERLQPTVDSERCGNALRIYLERRNGVR